MNMDGIRVQRFDSNLGSYKRSGVKMNMDEGGGLVQVVIKEVKRSKVRTEYTVRGHYVEGLNILFDNNRKLVRHFFFLIQCNLFLVL